MPRYEIAGRTIAITAGLVRPVIDRIGWTENQILDTIELAAGRSEG
jgi:hypothetical protein